MPSLRSAPLFLLAALAFYTAGHCVLHLEAALSERAERATECAAYTGSLELKRAQCAELAAAPPHLRTLLAAAWQHGLRRVAALGLAGEAVLAAAALDLLWRLWRGARRHWVRWRDAQLVVWWRAADLREVGPRATLPEDVYK